MSHKLKLKGAPPISNSLRGPRMNACFLATGFVSSEDVPPDMGLTLHGLDEPAGVQR